MSRKPRLIRFDLVDPVYQRRIRFFVGPTALLHQYAENLKAETPTDYDSAGVTWIWRREPEGLEVVCCHLAELPKTAETIAVLAHEAVHVADRVAEILGIGLSKETEEWRAYYVGWIVRTVLARLRSTR